MAARTFLGLVHFFMWAVAAYMMVLVPAMNIEYDRRRFYKESVASWLQEEPWRIGAKIGLMSGAVGISFGLLWWLGQ